jgi:ABC-type spermidine/putrescine transport system permease subunit II
MELSFEYSEYIKKIDSNPELILLWAGLGVPLLMVILAIPIGILRKIGMHNFIPRINTTLYGSLLLTWLLGSLVILLFYFLGISGLRLALIWIVLFLGYFLFCLLNGLSLRKLYNALIQNIKVKN